MLPLILGVTAADVAYILAPIAVVALMFLSPVLFAALRSDAALDARWAERKILVNLVGGMLGFLRPWSILVEKRWRLLFLWTFWPVVMMNVLAGRFGLLILMLTFAYIVIWLGTSVRDVQEWYRTRDDQSIYVERIQGAWLALVVLSMVWFPVLVGGVIDSDRPLMRIYGFFLVLAATALTITLNHGRKDGEGEGRTMRRWLHVAPMIGILGVPYFVRGAAGKGSAFLGGGILLLAALVWMVRYADIEWGFIDLFLIYTVPPLYIVLWLWPYTSPGRHLETTGDVVKTAQQGPVALHTMGPRTAQGRPLQEDGIPRKSGD